MASYGGTLLAASGVAVAAYTAYAAFWWLEVARIEKPKYVVTKVLKSTSSWYGKTRNVAELRQYAPYLIAEATVRDVPLKKAMGEGFRKVAAFIFGDNKAVGKPEAEKIAMTSPVRMTMPDVQSEKIAMTSPVRMTMPDSQAAAGAATTKPSTDEATPLMDPADGHTYKISFVMPSKYQKDTLPVPKNAELNIREVPAHTVAALAFGGPSPSPEVIEHKRQELLGILKENGIESQGDVMVYQYHPPFAPSFLRLNEVLYMVKNS